MRRLGAILRAIDTTSEWTGRIFFFVIAAMMVAVTYEVIARYFFNSPTIWAMEVSQFLLALCGAMGGAYTLLHRRHINVEILHDRLGTRGRAILDVITAFLFFLFIYYFFTNSLDMAIKSTQAGETTASYFAPPLYPVKIAIAVGVLQVFFQGLAKFIRDLVTATMGVAAGQRLQGAPVVEKK